MNAPKPIRSKLRTTAAIAIAATACFAGCGGTPLVPEAKGVRDADSQLETCSVAKDPLNPFVVEWPATHKTALETASQNGPVIVSYVGCTLKVLARCHASGRYELHSTVPARDALAISSEADLYAKLPLGAAALKGELRSGTNLHLEYVSVGQRTVDVPPTAISGECAGATHFVDSIIVGAFTLDTESAAQGSAGVDVGGMGGQVRKAEASKKLKSQGDIATCEKQPAGGSCGGLLQLGLAPLKLTEKTIVAPSTGADRPSTAASTPKSNPAAAQPRASGTSDPCLDEVLAAGQFSVDQMREAAANYAKSDIPNARKSALATINNAAASPRDRGIAYFMFGLLFEIESKADPTKVDLALQAYAAALKNPSPLSMTAVSRTAALQLAQKNDVVALTTALSGLAPMTGQCQDDRVKKTLITTAANAWAQNGTPANSASIFKSRVRPSELAPALFEVGEAFVRIGKSRAAIEALTTGAAVVRSADGPHATENVCKLFDQAAAIDTSRGGATPLAELQKMATNDREPKCRLLAANRTYYVANRANVEATGRPGVRGTNDKATAVFANDQYQWLLRTFPDTREWSQFDFSAVPAADRAANDRAAVSAEAKKVTELLSR